MVYLYVTVIALAASGLALFAIIGLGVLLVERLGPCQQRGCFWSPARSAQ